MPATSVPQPTAWQMAEVHEVRTETPRAKTIRFALPHWPGHLAGQHVDVRLTADDGYRAERSYSIASPPETAGAMLELTVERLDDGEVSPFLTDTVQPGDTIELRGPIGGHFVWSAAGATRPLLLVAGGSGIVPLMCMLRHWRLAGSTVPVALLYSSRTRADVIYHDELRDIANAHPSVAPQLTLTRERPADWTGGVGRIDRAAVDASLQHLGGAADCFVCGSNPFVEAAATLLQQSGVPAATIRTERFGGTA